MYIRWGWDWDNVSVFVAGMLIIWDRMFGTFTPETENVIYGLVHPLNSWNPIWAQFHHLYYIITTIGSHKGALNKLYFLINGPGWSEGKPRLGNIEDIPQVALHFHGCINFCPLLGVSG